MEGLMQPDSLRTRILLWTEEEIRLNRLPPKSGAILEAVLYRGELPRGDAAGIVGTGDRQARRVVSALIERGVRTLRAIEARLEKLGLISAEQRTTRGGFTGVSSPKNQRDGGPELRQLLHTAVDLSNASKT